MSASRLGKESARPKIRLAIVSEPGLAGVKRHVVDLLQHIDTDRFEVLFLYSLGRKDAQYEDQIRLIAARGIRCEPSDMVRSISPRADWRAFIQIRRQLREFQPAIVHAHSSKAGFLARFAAKSISRGIVTIYTPHLMACVYSRVYWVLEKMAAAATDRIVAVSESEARDIRNWRLVRPQHVVCVPVCVRPREDYPTRRRPVQDPPVIVGCGRISRQKNALLFIQVAAEILAQQPHWRFRWIGDFGDDDESRAVRRFMAQNEHARRVEVTGWVADADSQIADADVFCMVSRYESFGFVTADAMMMGVPVVATPATGTVDLVRDGVTGLLREPVVAQLAEAITTILERGAFRQRLAEAARNHVAKSYSLELMMERLEGLYRELAGR